MRSLTADIITDLRFGDCGKGKISLYLLKNREYDYSIRFNGGANAGHTVYHNNQKFVTHCLPMGLICGVPSIIDQGCVLNPKQFFKELAKLESQGIDTKGKIFISEKTHIITESHLSEDGKDTKIGTTKSGNGPAYRDKYARTGIQAKDIPELKPYLVDVYSLFQKNKPKRILFEGAQGLYLDLHFGEYPYVTSSHCSTAAAFLTGIPLSCLDEVWGCAKAYDTYVGTKSFQPADPIFNQIQKVGNEIGATTGRKRQCNWLHLDELKKGVVVNDITTLVISKMDILQQVGIWGYREEDDVVGFCKDEKEFKQKIIDTVGPYVKNIRWEHSPEMV